jgi:tetratricopeptide (TPR) repeat protein
MRLTNLILLLFSVLSFAQNIPTLTLENNKTLKLSKLHVNVDIIGHTALTTYRLAFYNETDKILEGELRFPLLQGQSVVDFAMDVNGKLRHAVIVEKEQARVAYESTIRQKIDPGLLEKTKGNSYKLRVYPIPPKGYKELLITYEERLVSNNNDYRYTLPLQFKKRISNFKLNINIHDKKTAHINNNTYYKSLNISTKGNITYERKNFIPKIPIEIDIESNQTAKVVTSNGYFNFFKTFLKDTHLMVKPKTVTLFWDASYSMDSRFIQDEKALLDMYFNYLKDVSVKLVVFNLKVKKEKIFKITNGNWKALKAEIENVDYDGGTSYLNLSKYKSDCNLLFTDGMVNLGDFEGKGKRPVYTINAVSEADHEGLSQIAMETGGRYINLKKNTSKVAFKMLTNKAYQFLGVLENKAVTEVYPLKHSVVTQDFLVSGKFQKNTTVSLLFGYNDKVLDTLTIQLTKGLENRLVKRSWAKEKLKTLCFNSETHKTEIIELAKKYGLITEYTSMLILDRVEDYVKYNIEPPFELRTAYKALVLKEKEKEINKQKVLESRKDRLLEDYKEIRDWYCKDFAISAKEKEEEHKNPIPLNSQIVRDSLEYENRQNEGSARGNVTSANGTAINEGVLADSKVVRDSLAHENWPTAGSATSSVTHLEGSTVNEGVIEGVVQSLSGEPIPGVNVKVQNGFRGVVTDFDGAYNLRTVAGDSIVFSYVGFHSIGTKVGEDKIINVSLADNIEALDEVVVIGYAAVERERLLGSVSTVRAENIETNSSNNTTKTESTAINSNLNTIITFKPWVPNADYLTKLSKTKNAKEAYSEYLILRKEYYNTPTFFMDVSDYFKSINEEALALQIVSNLVEIELDDHELMRALAYKLEAFKAYNLALEVYKEVLKLRPEEPQSYRDLALAYKNVEDYQKAFDLLLHLIEGNLLEKDEDERYQGIAHLAYVEACHLIQSHGEALQITEIQKRDFIDFKMDIRVVVDWNHDNTDLDLFVLTPENEKVYYGHEFSKEGGRLSNDMIDGYGPEEFMVRTGLKGNYEILVNYFSDQVQKISGPTTLKVTIYTNYGRLNEMKDTKILRLDKNDGELAVGRISI